MMHQQPRASFPTSQGVLNGGGGGGGGVGGNNNATNGISDTLARTLNLQRKIHGDDMSFRSKQQPQPGTKLIPPIPLPQTQSQQTPKASQPQQQQQQQPSSNIRRKIRPTRKDRQDRDGSESPPLTRLEPTFSPSPPIDCPAPSTAISATRVAREDVVILESYGPKHTPAKIVETGSDKTQTSSVDAKLASLATSVSNINQVRKQLDNSPNVSRPTKHSAPSKSITGARQSTISNESPTPSVTSTETSAIQRATPKPAQPQQTPKPGPPTQPQKVAQSSSLSSSQAPNKLKQPVMTQTPTQVNKEQQSKPNLTSTSHIEKQVEPKTPNKSPTMKTQQPGLKSSASKGWLEPDAGIFSWDTYLEIIPAEAAPREAFCQSYPPPVNKFQLKMKLEARDPRNPSSWCLATVVGIIGLRLVLRFDGCDTSNDFCELVDSANIRPVGSQPHDPLLPPLAYQGRAERYNSFVETKLSEKDAIIAQQDMFPPTPAKPAKNLFKKGMKLEAVDRKSPRWICPATIGYVNGDEVQISFDGWNGGSYDYTCKYSSRDLFPINWCRDTNHFIQLPQGWQNIICKGTNATGSATTNNNNNNPEPIKVAPKTPKTTERKPTPPPSCTPNKVRGRPKKNSSTPVKSELPTPEPSSETEEDTEEYKHLTDDERYTCQRAKPIQEWRMKGKQRQKEKRQMPRDTDSDSDVNNSSFKGSSAKRVRLDKPIATVTVDDILQILKSDETLAKYCNVFAEHEIDGKAFILLTNEVMIQHMGLKIGPVLKIKEIIDHVKQQNHT